ncbi:GpE family phage tail protein [Alteraurantiacibacter buctensis]|uniref:GpE family phage tail protein n=1 Tax=Alteraurantiacibacter buctensis TaxID=1503981 RepID=A0A844Z260_9SPHN|nr:GpE family phage tail protein [Alteraurantiacibacter buctensis]MXO73602.1 GpE family phage tail protein [Alteraurantiacibacter buctensis]
MADIAGIFHWSLADMQGLELDDLVDWHGRAVDFWKRTQGKGSK